MVENKIKYLIACELLNPQILQDPSKQQSANRVVFNCNFDNLDKKIVEKIKELINLKDDKYTLKITLKCGIYDIENLKRKIIEFDKDYDYEASNQSDQKAECFIAVLGGELNLKNKNIDKDEKISYKKLDFKDKIPLMDENFTLLNFSLSTSPWFVANFNKNLNMDDFNTFENDIKEEISSFLTKYKNRSISEYLSQIFETVNSKIAVNELLSKDLQAIISLVKKDSNSEDTLINSFFVNDLKTVLKFYENDSDEILDRYFGIREIEKNKRVDLRDDSNLNLLLPSFLDFPDGAFASKYSLMYSQQFAVNQIFKRFGSNNGAIYAVNGPPGTGKTTLLKDVIATIIVERAKVLSKMNENEIFTNPLTDNYNKTFYGLNPKLMGYEIVVTSSNNGAVENLSKEIPRFDSIDSKYEVDYFSEFASKLIDEKAWGLICVALGKSKNVYDFISKFIWKSNEKDFKYKFSKDMQTNDCKILGFFDYLKENNGSNFKTAKEEFQKSLEKVEKLRINLKTKYTLLEKCKEDKNELIKNHQRLKNIDFDAKIDDLNSKISDLKNKQKSLLNEKSDLSNSLNVLHLKKPPLFYFKKLFSMKSYKDYIDEINIINSKILEISKKLELNQIANSQISQNKINIIKDRDSLKKIDTQIEELNIKIVELNHFFSMNFEIEDLEKREKSSPFMKDENALKTELFEARVDVFIKALNLHKEAILANNTNVSNLLRNVTFINNSDLTPKQRQIIWKSLFFIIPVISSTFASFGRFFKDFDKDSIGYLLIDESGQAALANAVGALFRSKNAVIVGDPLQLEPVVTIPQDINQILKNKFKIENDFDIRLNSVQTMADKNEIYGTYLDDTWIGSPLKVHNRCNNPMFKISNTTTYDNMMIWGKSKNTNSFENENLNSCWIDVESDNFDGNANLREIENVKNLLLNKLKNIPKDDIKIISPFRDVVNALKKELIDFRNNIGTIHTMQGKEAKIIIFVLGGKTDGARKWASSKPNLLNVAVSRAKEFLYIVGNKNSWRNLEYFSDAVRLLDE